MLFINLSKNVDNPHTKKYVRAQLLVSSLYGLVKEEKDTFDSPLLRPGFHSSEPCGCNLVVLIFTYEVLLKVDIVVLH